MKIVVSTDSPPCFALVHSANRHHIYVLLLVVLVATLILDELGSLNSNLIQTAFMFFSEVLPCLSIATLFPCRIATSHSIF
jgi:hypothetical protein